MSDTTSVQKYKALSRNHKGLMQLELNLNSAHIIMLLRAFDNDSWVGEYENISVWRTLRAWGLVGSIENTARNAMLSLTPKGQELVDSIITMIEIAD